MTKDGPCPRCGAIYSTTCGQGSGVFIYGNSFGKKPENFPYSYDGVFDAYDIIQESLKVKDDIDRWRNYTNTVKPFLTRVSVCMACGFIYGEATDLQVEIWGIDNLNDWKRLYDDSK